MTSRADGFRYRGCCFAALVGSAGPHNFKAFTCLFTHRRFSALRNFETKSCFCERERLRPWMNPTSTTERRIDQPQHHNAFLQCRLTESTSIVSKQTHKRNRKPSVQLVVDLFATVLGTLSRSWIGIIVSITVDRADPAATSRVVVRKIDFLLVRWSPTRRSCCTCGPKSEPCEVPLFPINCITEEF